jgi:hypothetical protein
MRVYLIVFTPDYEGIRKGEAYAMIKALNKLMGLGIPEIQCIV